MRKTSGRVMRLQVTDLFFRSLFAFFMIDMQSRKVIHVGVHESPRSPTDTWTCGGYLGHPFRNRAFWFTRKAPKESHFLLQ
jgi:hypothetical protein